jgi:hypothetical protein
MYLPPGGLLMAEALTASILWLGCACLQEFAKRAAAFCGKDPSELAKAAPGVPAAQAPYFCLDLAFCHTVLTQGFDLSEGADFTLVKQVGSSRGDAQEQQHPKGCTGWAADRTMDTGQHMQQLRWCLGQHPDVLLRCFPVLKGNQT